MLSISIRGLSQRFGQVIALDRLDLDIAAGELFFLLGPSGCGKTTLLRAIAGFQLPGEGAILFDGEDVTRVPPHRRDTGMMFQSYALWPHLNVFRNVAFGLEERRIPKPEIKARVEEALAMVRLDGLGSRRINELSGGQQQRVALARALVVRPRCLLLDEPLSNLDAKLRIEMRGEIRRICKDFGLTAIYVTHDQKEALSMADRIALLDAGRLAQTGTPEQLYRHPASAFVAGFVGETNLLPGTLISASGEAHCVATALGELTGRLATPDWTPSPGESVLLSIRPECLALSPAPSGENVISGTLAESTYLGETVQYTLQAKGHPTPIHIAELNPRSIHRDIGEVFHASAKVEDVVVLRS
ncbi:MAG TPA: ABC transporter ATP-binding protein [Bacteroidia bacterium]|nr:ABC transporter ATP-binding protein [Bacteroidia bacterium]